MLSAFFVLYIYDSTTSLCHVPLLPIVIIILREGASYGIILKMEYAGRSHNEQVCIK